MKFNFKKITAMAGVFMASMFAVSGAVMASDYPAPFSDNVANTAIVYGSSALDTDESVANSIQADLAEYATESSSSTVTLGEDSAFISGTGDDLTFREAFSNVTTSLDEGDLSELLAEGTLEDESIDYNEEGEIDYFQDLDLSEDYVTFEALDEDDYVINTDSSADELPVLHVDQSSDQAYDLTVDFLTTAINASSYDDSESFTVAGKELTFDQEMSSTDTELVLFESTETVTLEMGESKTIGDDEVELTGGTSTTANLKINGQLETVKEGESESGFYVNKLITDDYSSETGSITVELFAGAEEWVLDTSGNFTDVEIENEDVEGVQAKVVTSSTNTVSDIEEITFRVTPSDMDEDEKSYLEMGEALKDPLFGFSMVFDGMEPELKSENKGKIDLSAGESVTLDFTSRNGNEYSLSPFEISSDNQNVTAGENWYADGSTYTSLEEDDIFVAYEGTAASESEETLVYQVANVEDDDGNSPYVEFEDLSGGSTIKVYSGKELKDTGLFVSSIADGVTTFDLLDAAGSAVSVNNQLVTENHMRMTLKNEVTIDVNDAAEDANVTLNGVNHVATWDTNATTTATALNTTLSDAGYSTSVTDDVVTISGYQVNTYEAIAGVDSVSNYADIFMEEDADSVFSLDTDFRSNITVKVGVDSSDEELTIKPTEGAEFAADTNSENDMEYAVSKLGTYYEHDNDEFSSIEIWTPTEGQTIYNVAFSGDVSEDEPTETGAMLITDSEVDDYEDHNLIVVGGSCINTAAANLLGVSEGTCGSDFTEATGVGSGQALIQGFSDSELTSEHAVLVAGYSADGTSDASKYLMNEAPDTSEKLKVTSATEASVVSE